MNGKNMFFRPMGACSECFFKDEIGFCRAEPPKIIAEAPRVIGGQKTIAAAFPPCPPDNLGCGRFYPREFVEQMEQGRIQALREVPNDDNAG
jgi:hypothetical protein